MILCTGVVSQAYILECFVTREWPYLKGLKGLGGVALFGGSVPLQVGVEVSKAHAKPPVSPSAYGSGYSSQLLSQCLHACYNASCHGDN